MSVKQTCNDLKYINYLSEKATLNRWIFRRDLKFSGDEAFLISAPN